MEIKQKAHLMEDNSLSVCLYLCLFV